MALSFDLSRYHGCVEGIDPTHRDCLDEPDCIETHKECAPVGSGDEGSPVAPSKPTAALGRLRRLITFEALPIVAPQNIWDPAIGLTSLMPQKADICWIDTRTGLWLATASGNSCHAKPGSRMTMSERTRPPQQLTLGGGFDAPANRNLFLGISPDHGAVGELTRLMQGLRDNRVIPHRTVDPDRLHVTLLYLGSFVDQIPPGLIRAVGVAAAGLRIAPFRVAFDRVCCTPSHVLLLPSEDLVELQAFRAELRLALIEAALSASLYTRALRALDKAFNPHVTLSYNPGHAPEMQVEPVNWIVREFHLIESLLGKNRHIRLGSWALAAE